MLSILNNLMADCRHPLTAADLSDQHSAMGLLNDEMFMPMVNLFIDSLQSGNEKTWKNNSFDETGVSSIQSDKNGLQISVDVQYFKPEELKVTVCDGYIVIDGKHEERSDKHGFISRQFTRRYKLPNDVDEAALVSSLSSDSVLTLKAPQKALPENKYREIPITHTNQPAGKATISGENCVQ